MKNTLLGEKKIRRNSLMQSTYRQLRANKKIERAGMFFTKKNFGVNLSKFESNRNASNELCLKRKFEIDKSITSGEAENLINEIQKLAKSIDKVKQENKVIEEEILNLGELI